MVPFGRDGLGVSGVRFGRLFYILMSVGGLTWRIGREWLFESQEVEISKLGI